MSYYRPSDTPAGRCLAILERGLERFGINPEAVSARAALTVRRETEEERIFAAGHKERADRARRRDDRILRLWHQHMEQADAAERVAHAMGLSVKKIRAVLREAGVSPTEKNRYKPPHSASVRAAALRAWRAMPEAERSLSKVAKPHGVGVTTLWKWLLAAGLVQSRREKGSLA